MIRALAIAIPGALILGSLLAPAAYSWFQTWETPPDWPYSRVFNRASMLSLLILILLLRKRLQFHRVGAAFRLGSWPERGRDFSVGLFVSALTAFAVLPLLVRGETMAWSGMDAGALAVKLLEALPAAILVSVIEESFFRVLVFDGLKQRLPWAGAAALASLFYAAVHFIAPDKGWVYPGWSPWVGFEYLGRVFGRFGLPAVLAGIVGLFLLGCVLCWVMQKRRSIYLCIGLHAGWFFVAKAVVYMATIAEGARLPAGVDKRYFLVGQPWTWASILVAALAVGWFVRGRPSLTPRAESA